MKRNGNKLLYILVILALVMVWFALTTPWPGRAAPLVAPLKLPSPASVWQAAQAAGLRSLLINSGATLLRVIAGGLLGTLCGWFVGLLMSQMRGLAVFLNPLIESVRPIPALAVFPLLILWLGIGFGAQIFVIAIATFSVIVIATYEAATRVDQQFLLTTRNFGGDSAIELIFVLVPLTLPPLIGPLRICVALAFANGIGAEFLGAQQGLGFLIRNARITLNTPGIILGTMLIGCLAASVDIAIRYFARRSTRWLNLNDNT